MEIASSRFGSVRVEPEDLLEFPQGIVGLERCRRWVLLADAHNDALGWLQSLERPHLALAVVSPRRFVPTYRFRVARRELSPLSLSRLGDAQVLVIVGKNEHCVTLNLKAPLVINVPKRLACQVVAKDDHPLQYAALDLTEPLKKIA